MGLPFKSRVCSIVEPEGSRCARTLSSVVFPHPLRGCEHGSQQHGPSYLGPIIASISPALTTPLHLLRMVVGSFVALSLTETVTFSQA